MRRARRGRPAAFPSSGARSRLAPRARRRTQPGSAPRRSRGHGRLVAAPSAEQARSALVDDWWEAHDRGESALMIAHRRADVADLNERARARMREAGRLGPDELETDARAFAVGDRVVTTRNDR